DNIYNKYATKYIEIPQRREDFIQFMKINVEEASGIVKYFRKWQSDLKQYDKVFEFFEFKNRSSIEEISKIANNTESAFNKDACYFLYKHYYYSELAEEGATYKYYNKITILGIDKNNKEWTTREIKKHDISNYEHLLSDINIMKYIYQKRQLRSEKIKLSVNNDYQIGQPKVYALSQKYWGKEIEYSVLSKIVNEWGPEVRKIGLEESFDKQNKQKIQEIFQFNGKELEKFCTIVRPINVSSWYILKKVGFKLSRAEISINFDDKGYDLLTLDNLLNYCEKLEEFINILYNNRVIEADKLYT
ncbi:11630_t:CDS:2, partial [Racocetra persica]